MSDIVVRCEQLGKKYLIEHEAGRRHNATLRESLTSFFRRKPSRTQSREEFWALKDVGFEVTRGEVIGIVGRNGAGKSTLLKILSRITEPTEGRVSIRGRVASLLEIGTGFHPELTGRENIYLNGAILGMSRDEVRRKFDEIVAFAGVERFLDTAVKHYSSGMHVRLAFAVAGHLEPEILVVDEVLAVGDAEFQKKCIGKMTEVAGHGRTVLFVSHNMNAVQALCRKGVLLEKGHVVAQGDIGPIVNRYLSTSNASLDRANTSEHEPQIVRASIDDSSGEALKLRLSVVSPSASRLIINVRLKDSMATPVAIGSAGGFDPGGIVELHAGTNELEVTLDTSHLATGEFGVSIDLERPYNHFIERLEDCLSFVLTRVAVADYGRVLQQSWSAGYVEIDAHCVVLSTTPSTLTTTVNAGKSMAT